MQQGSIFSTLSLTSVIFGLYDDSHSDRCEMKSCCGFDLHFPGYLIEPGSPALQADALLSELLVMLSIFSCVYQPLVCLLWKNVFSGLLPIFFLIDYLFDIELCMLLIYVVYKFLSLIWSHFLISVLAILAAGERSKKILL